MDTLTLTLGDMRFVLAPGTPRRRVEKRLAAAMRRGAGVVRLPLAGGGEVDALVTAAVPVALERRPVVEPERGDSWRRSERVEDWTDTELQRAL